MLLHGSPPTRSDLEWAPDLSLKGLAGALLVEFSCPRIDFSLLYYGDNIFKLYYVCPVLSRAPELFRAFEPRSLKLDESYGNSRKLE